MHRADSRGGNGTSLPIGLRRRKLQNCVRSRVPRSPVSSCKYQSLHPGGHDVALEMRSFESTVELFTAARELLMSRGFPEEVALTSTYFVFPTWFPEFLPIAPCLSIAGPRPEAALLLQLLGWLVRRPLPLGDVTRSGLC